MAEQQQLLIGWTIINWLNRNNYWLVEPQQYELFEPLQLLIGWTATIIDWLNSINYRIAEPQQLLISWTAAIIDW